VRAAVATLDGERIQLQAEREQLDAEIARLEASLSEPVKQLLGIKD
jgi:hypothetical protein